MCAAITVENLSKAYHIGLKQERHDTFVGALQGLVRAPLENFRHLSRLNTFRHCDDSEDIFWALRDVSFEVQEGEVVGIIGRNGAGKSTLLKILSRITEPTRGRVVIRGRVSSLLEVGTGFHQELTGRENVYMNGTILGMTKREIDHKFDEIVDFAGVEKFLDTPIKHYSSGMKVRLAFSVAAHLEPEILIIDEVLAVGDAEFQKKCLGKMHDVARGGRTVLFVSHNMAAVRSLTSRSAYLAAGQLVCIAATEDIIGQYHDDCYVLRTTTDGDPLTPFRKFKSPDADIRFTRVWVESGRDTKDEVPKLPLGESFSLHFEVESACTVQTPYVVAILSRDQEQRVATLFSGDNGFALSLEAGRHVITCQFQNPPFSPGRYSLEARVTLSPRTKAYDALVDLPIFEIEMHRPGHSPMPWPTRPWGAVHLNGTIEWSSHKVVEANA